MAVDKLVDSTQLDTDLTSVANAIRTKGGTSAQLAFPADFVSAIAAISGGGGLPVSVLNHETVTPSSDITKDNRLRLSLTPVTNYLLLYFSDDDIPTGASTRGIAATRMKIGSNSVAQAGVILRADGTQGTDGAALSGFTESTGVLLFPSTQGYSSLVAGKTYEFWLFEIGGFA